MDKKRMRGKGKKPAMKHMTIRVPKEVYDCFYKYPSPTRLIRDVLTQYVKQELTNEEQGNENISAN